MRRTTERALILTYLACFGALAGAAVWAQQKVMPPPPDPTWEFTPVRAQPDKAPDFKLKDLDGNEVSLGSLRGEEGDNVVVLEWFDPRCDWVRAYHEHSTALRDLARKHRSDGVTWVAIYSSTPPEDHDPNTLNAEAVDAWGIMYPVLLDTDGAVARLYSIDRAPTAVVVSASGDIVYAGAIDNAIKPGTLGTENYLRRAIEATLRGETPADPAAPGPGCHLQAEAPSDRP